MHHRSVSPRALRVSALAAGATLLFSLAGSFVSAATTPYSDVPSGAYYESAAAALLTMHALDADQAKLRPADLAIRAEVVKLLVNVSSSGATVATPTTTSFDDVSRYTWYWPYFEAAAKIGWVHGDQNCYQTGLHPCTARPSAPVNRAEAAALLVRAFALDHSGLAPAFADNASDQWYYDIIQTAADHCVLQGDIGTGLVRPAADMNRAEMITMFYRASQHLLYGRDCGVPISSTSSTRSSSSSAMSSSLGSLTGHIIDGVAESSTKIRLTFDTDLERTRAQQSTQYRVTAAGGSTTLPVRSASLLDSRTVELSLGELMEPGASYIVGAQSLLTTGGAAFTDTRTVTYSTVGTVPFTATLTGSNEVPPVTTPASGSGSFTLTGSGLIYSIIIKNMSGAITAAHFRTGDPGVNGPILQSIPFTRNHADGTWTNISDDQRSAILGGRIYVNVNTTQHPDGEIRGQLQPQ